MYMLFITLYRAEELEIALMEMVKEDNRLELSARVYLDYLQTKLLAIEEGS